VKLHRRSLGLALLAPTLCLCGCPQKVNITATCVDNNNVTSADFGPSRIGNTSIGILNTHHFGPGNVIELIPPIGGSGLGTGSLIETLNYSPADFVVDDPPADTSQVIATDWEISASANLPQTVQANIQSSLKSNTELKITGGSRHGFAQPLLLIEADNNLKSQILQHTDRTYIVVTGIVNATGVSLQYGKQNSGSGGVSVVKFGNFAASISYNCSNVTTIAPSGQTKAGVAFFYTTVAAVNGKVDTVSTADLTKYSLSNALM
jgi:hypothetical protein